MRSPEPTGPPAVVAPLTFGLLGPFSVEISGRPVELPGTRSKAVLAILLINANRVVSTDRLVEDLWAGTPTPGATATLQGYVSELRKALTEARGGPAPVQTRRPGYVINVEPEQLDVLRFEQLIAQAKATRPEDVDERAALLRNALKQWRGPALADFAHEPFARPVAVRLEEARMWALEERVEAELGAGGHGDLITELGTLTAENPLRERLWAQLMMALYRCGRQAEALRAYQTLRRRLGEELAIDPSPALQRLEHAILIQDPALELIPVTRPSPAGGGPATPAATPADGAGADAPRRDRLPVNLTRFVGRSRELRETGQRLSQTRLLTLAGSSGSGKTRLAVELAASERERWPDGVYFVDLSALEKPDLVPAAVAASMGLSELGADTGSVCTHLGDAQALLLLDNCEHVVDACADLVEAVLSACPRTTILTTSQEELRIGSETVWRVPPLSLPHPGDNAEPMLLLASEAVQLFLERAPAPSGECLADPPLIESVAYICERLDGIPLAIELAASMVAVLPLSEIVRRLDDRLALLTRSNRRAVSRHRTLRAAIEWNYELLEESERELFQRLSVFVRHFSLEAAEAASGAPTFLADLSALISKSMVATVPGPTGTRRYQLLDSLRLYGLERLRASGRESEARGRHAAYYMSFTVAAERQHHGPEPDDWTTRVIEELPNIRSALEWSFTSGDHEVAVQMAGALRCGYFARMGQLVEARQWLEESLAPDRGLSGALRLKALTAATTLAFSLGDYRWSATVGEEAVALAEELQDRHDLAFAFMARGSAAIFEGRIDRAVECLNRSLAYCEEIGDEWTRASVLTFRGVVARRLGDDNRARSQLTEALSIYRHMHDEYNQVMPILQLALVAQHLGELDESMQWCDQATALARRLGDRQLAHSSLCVAGLVELGRGRCDQARALFASSLTTARGLEHNIFVALAVEGFAVIAHEEGRHADAARLWGFTQELRSAQAVPLSREREAERERRLAHARDQIGPEAVDEAMAAGRHLTYQQVLEDVGAA